jgi:valyl-tRNA synthetase
VTQASAALEAYDHAGALEVIERFFWMFCDDYLELVKERAYDADTEGGASARSALQAALHTLLRLLAPFLPFVTEEVWSWWRDGSVHAAAWPSPTVGAAGDPAVLAAAAQVLGQIRKAKSAAQVSMRAEAARVVVQAPEPDFITAASPDLMHAGNIAELVVRHAPELSAEVTL